jgi:hypothetical protein
MTGQKRFSANFINPGICGEIWCFLSILYFRLKKFSTLAVFERSHPRNVYLALLAYQRCTRSPAYKAFLVIHDVFVIHKHFEHGFALSLDSTETPPETPGSSWCLTTYSKAFYARFHKHPVKEME